MSLAVQVRLRNLGSVHYFSVARLQLMPSLGEAVIVESDRGDDYGEIVSKVAQVVPRGKKTKLMKILRVASQEDFQKITENKEKAREAYAACKSKVAEYDLPMKLITCEYTFDRRKVVFYFSAAQRVDFRQLVKDLATQLKTRIELVQVGVRDEAKMLGGLGPCGCKLCCTRMLSDFNPVSIRMAKDQQLPLNPSKISGMCGRLMCCLSYEHPFYKEALKTMPRVGDAVIAEKTEGKVVGLNCLKKTVIVQSETGKQTEFPAEAVVLKPPEEDPESKRKKRQRDE